MVKPDIIFDNLFEKKPYILQHIERYYFETNLDIPNEKDKRCLEANFEFAKIAFFIFWKINFILYQILTEKSFFDHTIPVNNTFLKIKYDGRFLNHIFSILLRVLIKKYGI